MNGNTGDSGAVRSLASHWDGAILVCGKCSKKLGGGFGPKRDEKLTKLLRKALAKGKKGRKAPIGVVETKCLDLCPKRGVTVVDTRVGGRWLVVPAGADIAALATRLAPPQA